MEGAFESFLCRLEGKKASLGEEAIAADERGQVQIVEQPEGAPEAAPGGSKGCKTAAAGAAPQEEDPGESNGAVVG